MQLLGVQAVREVVNALGDLPRAIQRFMQQRAGLYLEFRLGAPNDLEIDREERQLLADIVMELPGNPGSFRFLCHQQAAAQVPNAIVARPQLRLAAVNQCLRLSSSHTLDKQKRD